MPADEQATKEPTPLTAINAEQKALPPKAEKKPQSGGYVSALLLVVVLALGAALAYLWLNNQNLNQSMMQVSRQMDAATQQIADLQHQGAALQQEQTKEAQALQTQSQTLQEWSNYLPKGPSRDFLGKVLGAEVWVRLANTNLLLNNDVPAANAYLASAVAELSSVNNPEVDSLKKALADDQATLKNAAWVNQNELYQRLTDLQKEVSALPLVTVPAPKSEVQTDSDEANLSSWQLGLRKSWQALRQIVVVYHLPGTNTPPFITPDQGPYIYQNLNAVLAEASWALLHHNDQVYHASLERSLAWVQQYFLQSAPETQKMLKELADLNALSLQSTKDLQLQSPKVFQDYLKSVQ